jgi:hypothetical protein
MEAVDAAAAVDLEEDMTAGMEAEEVEIVGSYQRHLSCTPRF